MQPAPGRGRRQRQADPFWELEGLFDRMGQLIQGAVGDLPVAAPIADIEETDDAFIVELDLPGVRPEDVNVEVTENLLRVTGEYKERERAGLLRRQERPVGRFEHIVAVPGDVDPENVEAMLDNGVLRVRMAKSAQSQPRRIEVRGSSS